MDSPYLVISGFITALEEAAADLAPKGFQWKVVDRSLQLTPLPEGIIPNFLRLTRRLEAETWLASDDVLGVVHVVDPGHRGGELDPETRGRVEGLAAHTIAMAPPALATALDEYSDHDTPVGGLTRVDLIARGVRRSATIFLEDHPGARDALAARIPWVSEAVSVDDPVARLVGDETGQKSFVYCAATAADGERHRTLDARLARGETLTGEEIAVLGELRSVPRCCVDAFDPALFAVPSRLELVAWLDVFLAAAARSGVSPVSVAPPGVNFIAAALYQLFFLEHLPCGPRCAATVEQNQRALAALYAPDDAARVHEMLSTSFLCWPDGRLVPFRVDRIQGNTVHITDLGRLRWPDHMASETRSLLRMGLAGAGDSSKIDALRWTGAHWELREAGRWLRLRERGRWFRSVVPKIALFGEDPTDR